MSVSATLLGVLASNDGDFTAFAKPLGQMSGGAGRVVGFAKMK